MSKKTKVKVKYGLNMCQAGGEKMPRGNAIIAVPAQGGWYMTCSNDDTATALINKLHGTQETALNSYPTIYVTANTGSNYDQGKLQSLLRRAGLEPQFVNGQPWRHKDN